MCNFFVVCAGLQNGFTNFSYFEVNPKVSQPQDHNPICLLWVHNGICNINPNGVGGWLCPHYFQRDFSTWKKMVLEVWNFLNFPNSLWIIRKYIFWSFHGDFGHNQLPPPQPPNIWVNNYHGLSSRVKARIFVDACTSLILLSSLRTRLNLMVQMKPGRREPKWHQHWISKTCMYMRRLSLKWKWTVLLTLSVESFGEIVIVRIWLESLLFL